MYAIARPTAARIDPADPACVAAPPVNVPGALVVGPTGVAVGDPPALVDPPAPTVGDPPALVDPPAPAVERVPFDDPEALDPPPVPVDKMTLDRVLLDGQYVVV